MDTLIKDLVPLLVTFIIGILTIATRALLQVVGEYITLKKESVIKAIGQQKYDEEIKMAKSIWLIVEEHFRINKIAENVMNEKIQLFNNLLLKRIPYLQQSDIDHLRQTVAGEFNQWKSTLNSEPVPISGSPQPIVPCEIVSAATGEIHTMGIDTDANTAQAETVATKTE